jgi:NitT/TauT family transport system permease protein
MSQASTPPPPRRPRARADRGAAGAPRARHPWLSPLVPVSPRARWLLGMSFFVAFFAVWAVATLGGFVSRTFLADPLTMAHEGWLLFTEYGFIGDIGMTVWRVVGGFVLAACWPCRWASSWARTRRRRRSSSRSCRSAATCRRRRSFRC